LKVQRIKNSNFIVFLVVWVSFTIYLLFPLFTHCFTWYCAT